MSTVILGGPREGYGNFSKNENFSKISIFQKFSKSPGNGMKRSKTCMGLVFGDKKCLKVHF